jgi:very-short-patch-repair endonuclease
MATCECCNSKHSGAYGSGRFCSISCAHAFRKTQKAVKRFKFYTNIKGFGSSREPSYAEKWFIQFLDSNGLKNRYRREEKIGHYWADFFFPESKIVLEVDGASHYSKKAQLKDARRTRFIERLGYKVYRIRWGGPRNIRVAKAFDFLTKVK